MDEMKYRGALPGRFFDAVGIGIGIGAVLAGIPEG